MKCSWCGREQPAGWAFCSYCGSAASQQAANQSRPSARPGIPCVCGRSLTSDDLYCPDCGRATARSGTPGTPGFSGAPGGGYEAPTYNPGAFPPAGYPPAGAPGGGYPPPGAPGGGYPPAGPYGYGGQYLPVIMPAQAMYPYRRKDKVAAGILAILLGTFGAHKFYLGEIGMGILYLVFSFTLIPGLVGLVEGIVYLCESDQTFDYKHNFRP
ncbi:MAG TPA: TM2 domain-containing protein [Armatimonadota bacterium]|nr:TM2 domain-containing protein [Armatimonadota bacterium]